MTELPLEVDVATIKQKLDRKDPFLLLDCREQNEYDQCRIAGAELFPMSQIQERSGELEGRKNDLIIVHCHHGGRSLRVARWLRQQGFAQAQSMAGGIDGWSVQIDPTVPRY